MKKSLVILALVAGCGASDHGGNGQQAAGARQRQGGGSAAVTSASASMPDPTGLTGLWEGGAPARPNQLCMVPKGDSIQFGITIWGANMASCSGAGIAERNGGRVTLTMTGDSPCTIEAKVEGNRIVLPADLPQGCAYYCGQQARFAGASFALRHAGAAAAGKAKDLAGDPLCG